MTPEKKQIISDMIQMAKADNTINEQEYNFILAIAERLGMDKATVDMLTDSPVQETVFKTELDRITQFQRVLLLTNVDQERHLIEVEALRNYALKLGIRPEAVEQILVESHDYENKLIPGDRLVEIFKRFYN